MKNLKITIIATISILSLSSCSSNTTVAPSQNESLNSVTNSTAEKNNKGSMQKSLDSWLKDEWTPKVEKDEDIKAKNQDKERDFKLQEYIDKSEVYMKESNSTTQDSHYKKMESMPVIGK
ncbi:hypothetical protein [Sulfurimonas sp. CS5]|jgi:hypothetical protein|uniref:hypothetical protein n=1 Tax=Sulfurimonas sp. CS5 TaxID=3391145 RepID=UPI0039E95A8A